MTAELIMPQFDPWAGLMLSPALTPVQGVSMTATVPFTQARQMGVDTSYLLHKGPVPVDGGRQGKQSTNPLNRGSSHYRGVTHHARTNRYESHIWDDGKQVYLGGFYNEDQAALAYDLAAIRFRGEEAATNFPPELYDQEMEERHQYTRHQVVACLRQQSKAMNKVDLAGMGVKMAPWEVLISAALQPGKVHIGVYGSEVEAARAYDRGLVQALGIDAAPLLNFQLLDYIDLLTPMQLEMAVARGLLPSVLPPNFIPPLPSLALYQLGNDTVEAEVVNMGGRMGPLSSSDEGVGGISAMAGGANGQLAPVPRRKSVTPRSVLDFEDAVINIRQPGEAGDICKGGKEPAAKRQRLDSTRFQ